MRDLNNYYNEYCNLPFEKIQIYFRRKKVLECLEQHNHAKLCEIGCGLDPLFNHLKIFDRMHVVEPILGFYENACAEAKGKGNITVHLGRLEDNVSTLSHEEFDFIVISSLLHEVNNPEELLRCIHHISLEHTVIHINVPNARSFHRILAYEMGLIDNIFEKSATQKKMQQYTTFSLDTLEQFVIKNGFQVLELGSYFLKPFTHEQMQAMYNHKIINIDILNGLDLMVKHMPEFGSEIFVNIKANK